jgi:hypothetical protein
MAKKTSASKKPEPVSKKPVAKAVSTPVRNSSIPKAAPVTAHKAIEITGEMIAKRAFEIHASGRGGSELDNWFAAERELRSGI